MKTHLVEARMDFKSVRMQELIIYAGQLDCYERSNEVIRQFLNVEIGHTQAHRVTDPYGEELGKTPMTERSLPPVRNQGNTVCRG